MGPCNYFSPARGQPFLRPPPPVRHVAPLLFALSLLLHPPFALGQRIEEENIKFCNSTSNAERTTINVKDIKAECWITLAPESKYFKQWFREIVVSMDSDCESALAFDGSLKSPCPMEPRTKDEVQGFDQYVQDGIRTNLTLYKTEGFFAGEVLLVVKPKEGQRCSWTGSSASNGETATSKYTIIGMLMAMAFTLVFLTALLCSGMLSRGKGVFVTLPSSLCVWSFYAFLFSLLFLAVGFSTWHSKTGWMPTPVLVIFGWVLLVFSLLGCCCVYPMGKWTRAQVQRRIVDAARFSNVGNVARKSDAEMVARAELMRKKSVRFDRLKKLAVLLSIIVDALDCLSDFIYTTRLFVFVGQGHSYLAANSLVGFSFMVCGVVLYFIPSLLRRYWFMKKDREEISESFLYWTNPIFGWVWEDGPLLIVFVAAEASMNCKWDGVSLFMFLMTVIGMLKKLAQSVLGYATDKGDGDGQFSLSDVRGIM